MLSNKERAKPKTDYQRERMTPEYFTQSTAFWKRQCLLSCREQQIAKAVRHSLRDEKESSLCHRTATQKYMHEINKKLF